MSGVSVRNSSMMSCTKVRDVSPAAVSPRRVSSVRSMGDSIAAMLRTPWPGRDSLADMATAYGLKIRFWALSALKTEVGSSPTWLSARGARVGGQGWAEWDARLGAAVGLRRELQNGVQRDAQVRDLFR